MRITSIVCIKSVIVNAPDGKASRSSETCELNPFDRPALEMALRLKEMYGGSVTALSMGPEETVSALLEAVAMGVDRAVLVSDSVLAGSDTLATSTVLAAAIKKLAPYDLVFFGTRTSDSDTGQVGPQTAVLLDVPIVSGTYSLEKVNGGFHVARRIDGYQEKYDMSLPAALTIHPPAVEARDLALSGIQTAFEEYTVEIWGLTKLDVVHEEVGEAGSPTRVVSLKRLEKERKCKSVSGLPEEQAEDLVKQLVAAGLIG